MFSGTICYTNSYHPMDRSNTSNRMGVWSIRLAVLLLIISPILLMISTFTFAYTKLQGFYCPGLIDDVSLKKY